VTVTGFREFRFLGRPGIIYIRCGQLRSVAVISHTVRTLLTEQVQQPCCHKEAAKPRPVSLSRRSAVTSPHRWRF